MKISKLVLALIGSIALPLGALAADQYGGQTGTSQGSSQYGSGQTGTDTSGTSQSGSNMNQSGMSGSQSGGSSGQMGRANAPTGAEGSAGLPMFDALDKNKDGFISKSEANKSATAKKNFRSLDTDRDGKISHDEWQAGGGQ